MALKALKGERTVSELATAYEVDLTMTHQFKKAVLQGISGVFPVDDVEKIVAVVREIRLAAVA